MRVVAIGSSAEAGRAACAGPSGAFARLGQLQEVVHRTDQAPFAAHLLQAAQQELPEPPRLFDLPEYRLGQCLSEPVAAAPTRSRQLQAHPRRCLMGSIMLPHNRGIMRSAAMAMRLALHRRMRCMQAVSCWFGCRLSAWPSPRGYLHAHLGGRSGLRPDTPGNPLRCRFRRLCSAPVLLARCGVMRHHAEIGESVA